MSLTSSSSSRDRDKYGGIWGRSINFFKGCSLCDCDAFYRRVLLIMCSMNHILPHLSLSRVDDDDVRDIGKHDFRSFYFTLCYLMQTVGSLSNSDSEEDVSLKGPHSPKMHCASRSANLNFV